MRDASFYLVSLHIFGVNSQIKKELIESVKGKKGKNKIDFLFSPFSVVSLELRVIRRIFTYFPI